MKLIIAAVLVACLGRALALPGGAPSQACENLTPNHPPNSPQNNPSNYRIDISEFAVEGSNNETEFIYMQGMSYTSKN